MTLAVAADTPFRAWFDPDVVGPLGDVVRHDIDGCRIAAPGVFAIAGRPLVVLPRCYANVPLPATALLSAALSVVQVLATYRRRKAQKLVQSNAPDLGLRTVGRAEDLLEHLEAAMLLDADHRRHGPLRVARRRRAQRTNGRIDWPRTVRRSVHVAAPDGNVTVADPWLVRHAIEPRDPLTELHVASSLEANSLLHGAPPPPRTWPRREALALLDRREHELFQDRHRHVHGLLRRYHSASAGGRTARTQDVAALYASDFALIWEAMLSVALGADTSRRFHGHYHRVDGTRGAGVTLLPDAVVELPEGVLVVDAKHYRPDRLPATESIAKQLLYRWLLSCESGHGRVPMDRILNVFALPMASDTLARSLAVHRLDGDQGAHAFGTIHVLEVGFQPIADAFVSGRRHARLGSSIWALAHP